MHKTTHNYTLQKLEVYASWIVPARKIKICHIFGIKRPKKSCFVFSFYTTYIVFSRDWNRGPLANFEVFYWRKPHISKECMHNSETGDAGSFCVIFTPKCPQYYYQQLSFFVDMYLVNWFSYAKFMQFSLQKKSSSNLILLYY